MVVVHEQTHVEWRAGKGAIRDGRVIVIAGTPPADGFFAPRATYSVHATDGGNRTRYFPNLTLTAQNGNEYVFD
ncbi:MAG TPA: hypothetical protein VNI54_02025 [Thermoanaerobaculia bacterium]|nr:hypothetical protein [Thermoanaerobaculia bacterium]